MGKFTDKESILRLPEVRRREEWGREVNVHIILVDIAEFPSVTTVSLALPPEMHEYFSGPHQWANFGIFCQLLEWYLSTVLIFFLQ